MEKYDLVKCNDEQVLEYVYGPDYDAFVPTEKQFICFWN